MQLFTKKKKISYFIAVLLFRLLKWPIVAQLLEALTKCILNLHIDPELIKQIKGIKSWILIYSTKESWMLGVSSLKVGIALSLFF